MEVQPTYDITSSDNLISLAKYYGINFIVSLVVILLLGLISSMNIDLFWPGVILMLMGQLFVLRWFESVDGCKR
jgi:hypothetical protein